MDFIDSITHYKVSSGKSEVTIAGERDMIGLLDAMSMVFIWEYFMRLLIKIFTNFVGVDDFVSDHKLITYL